MPLFLKLTFALVFGSSVPDIQGEWHISNWRVKEPGTDTWSGLAYSRAEKIWHVQGPLIEVEYEGRKFTSWIVPDPQPIPGVDFTGAAFGGPKGVRFIDSKGQMYYGKYALKDGELTLSLGCNAPVKGLANTMGTELVEITLGRPMPPPPPRRGAQTFRVIDLGPSGKFYPDPDEMK